MNNVKIELHSNIFFPELTQLRLVSKTTSKFILEGNYEQNKLKERAEEIAKILNCEIVDERSNKMFKARE